MTNVTIYKKDGYVQGFKMEGHACFNTQGPDILCASLSMAGQMVIMGLLKMLGAETVELLEIDEPTGLLSFKLKEKYKNTNEAIIAFEIFKIGITDLVTNELYCKHVCIKEEES